MAKYDPLNKFFSGQNANRITLTFSEIEAILGDSLPPSAYRYPVWWNNSATKAHPYSHSWMDSGYFTVDVSATLHDERITFERP